MNMNPLNSWWTRYLPGFLREWLEGRQQLQRTIGNTGWLLVDRVLRIVIGLSVGAWVARYLGPTEFGQLSYVISFIAFFQVVAGLDADAFVVRDIAREGGAAANILGTALQLRLICGVISWMLAVFGMFLLHPHDHQLILLTALVGATLVFQASDTIDLWFQSQSKSRRTVLAKSASYLFSNLVKVALLIFKAPLVAFAGVICLEAAALSASLVLSYRRFPTEHRWTPTMARAKSLLGLSWPFLLSSLMITAYMRIDQLMLKEMLGEEQLGIYAAALPLSQVWCMIPTTLVTSLAPYVAQKMTQSEQAYREALVKIFRFFAVVSLLSSIATALAAPLLIRIMYGTRYEFAAVILSAHVFVNVLVFQGIAQDLWTINKNVRGVTLIATISAALIGIVSNAVFIRQYGPIGGVISYFLATVTSVTIVPCALRPDLLQLYRKAFLPGCAWSKTETSS